MTTNRFANALSHPTTSLLRLVLILAGIAWGLTVAVSPWQFDNGWSPIALVFWQSVVTVILILAWMLVRKMTLLLSGGAILFYVGMTLFGTALPQVLSLMVSEHIAASFRAVIYALIPMLSLGFGLLLGTERLAWQKLLGLALGLLAMLIIAGPGAATGGFGGQALPFGWLAVLVIVVALYAFQNNWVKRMMPSGMHPFVALLGANIFAAAFLLPVVLGMDAWMGIPFSFTPQDARPTAMFWLVTVLHLFAYASLLYCINHGGPAFGAQISYVLTTSGVVWGIWLMPGERFTWPLVVALVLVLLGIAFVKPSDSKAADPPNSCTA